MKKVLCVLMGLALLITSGCGPSKQEVTEGGTLTYWVEFNNQVTAGVEKMSELPPYQYIQKKFNCTIDFKHPVKGQAQEQFNLMLSSRELPDIISYDIVNQYPGGVSKALKDGTIIKLDLKGKAPNLYKYLKEHPEIDKEIKTDEGDYYCFPCINEDEIMLYYYGMFLRQDCLDAAGVEKPETIDEWYDVLTALKGKNGVGAPVIMDFENLIAQFGKAFNVYRGLAIEDGKVKFMLTTDGVKDFLATMKKWYDEGLIDRNLANVDSQMVKSYMIKGSSAVTAGTLGGNLAAWQKLMDEEGKGKKLAAVASPVLNKGDTNKVFQHKSKFATFGSVYISSQCKNLDLAYEILDFGYSEEGRKLFNYGIEGESYTMVDGKPIYTDLITNNPEGKNMSDMIQYYACPNNAHPVIRERGYYDQYMSTPTQQEALSVWYDPNAKDCSLPFVSLTAEETDSVSGILNDLYTYADGYMLKVITGVESVDSIDEYMANMESRGVKTLEEVYQKAYDRYLKR